jgi:hypothetical protein
MSLDLNTTEVCKNKKWTETDNFIWSYFIWFESFTMKKYQT